MNAAHSQFAADKARDTHRQTGVSLEHLGLDAPVPVAIRAVAEKTVAQTREAYEHSKHALEAAVESWEKSLDAAGQGAVALNRKFIDIAQRNLNSGFDLAKSLAGAKNLTEMADLQAAYWRKQLDAFASQGEEIRALSTKITTLTAEPLKAHVTRSMDEMRKAS